MHHTHTQLPEHKQPPSALYIYMQLGATSLISSKMPFGCILGSVRFSRCMAQLPTRCRDGKWSRRSSDSEMGRKIYAIPGKGDYVSLGVDIDRFFWRIVHGAKPKPFIGNLGALFLGDVTK